MNLAADIETRTSTNISIAKLRLFNYLFPDLIRPICMPKESELRARNFVDYKPIIAGWGDTKFRKSIPTRTSNPDGRC